MHENCVPEYTSDTTKSEAASESDRERGAMKSTELKVRLMHGYS